MDNRNSQLRVINKLWSTNSNIIGWRDVEKFITSRVKLKSLNYKDRIGLMCGTKDNFNINYLGKGFDNHALCVYESKYDLKQFLNNLLINIYHSYSSDFIDISLFEYKENDFESFKNDVGSMPLIPHISSIKCIFNTSDYIKLFLNLYNELKNRRNLLLKYGITDIDIFNEEYRNTEVCNSYIKRRLIIIKGLDYLYDNKCMDFVFDESEFVSTIDINKIIINLIKLGSICGIHLLIPIHSGVKIINDDIMDCFTLKYELLNSLDNKDKFKNCKFKIVESSHEFSKDKFIIPYISDDDLYNSLTKVR